MKYRHPETGTRWPLQLNWLLYLLLFVAIYAGFQGGRYYLANRVQELGIASALLIFGLGAWRALFQVNANEWRRWVVAPVVLIVGIMACSAAIFTLNYAGNVAYGFFSAREFLLAFLGPGVYLLCRCGLSVRAVHQVIWLSLVVLMLNYLAFYFTMDLRAAFFSSDHTISNLVTYDEWRGFRLKPPMFAVILSVLAASVALVQQRSFAVKLMAALTIGLAAYIWSIVLLRSTLATMLLAVALYPLLLGHRNRVQLGVVLVPLALLAIPTIVVLATDFFMQADGGDIRAKAFAKALQHFRMHPIFGAGEDSAYGRSYQDIVARYFFPSDLGIVGVAYKYGLVGTMIYLFMHTKIWLNLWRANLLSRACGNRLDPLVWAFLMFMTAQTFNLMLNPGLAYAQGITAGTLAMALARLVTTQAAPCADGGSQHAGRSKPSFVHGPAT